MGRILLFEDDLALVHEWRIHLAEANHEVYTATHADHALTLVEQHNIELCVVDFIIKDSQNQRRPKGSLTFVNRLRSLPRLAQRRIPVIGVSGYDQPSFGVNPELHLRSLGALDFIRKPFPPDVLRQRIERLLALRGDEWPRIGD